MLQEPFPVEAPAAIARPHIVLIFVHKRVRKTASPINDRGHRDLAREPDVSPEEQAIGRVEWLQRILVGTNHRMTDIAEVAIKVVQIAESARTHIGHEEIVLLLKAIAP